MKLKFGITGGIPAYPWKPFVNLGHYAASSVGITGLL